MWMLIACSPVTTPLAPALYSCRRAIGDVFMVVMRRIPASEGKSLSAILNPPPTSQAAYRDPFQVLTIRQDASKALEAVCRDVSQALGLLHG